MEVMAEKHEVPTRSQPAIGLAPSLHERHRHLTIGLATKLHASNGGSLSIRRLPRAPLDAWKSPWIPMKCPWKATNLP